MIALGKSVALSAGLLALLACQAEQVTPLKEAHAHNDYDHRRPLLDALSYGFTSIEADVLLIDGTLFVGHDMPIGANELPTLANAYLEPLEAIVSKNGGTVYPGFEDPFYLMIDFKTEANSTYEALKEALEPFRQILNRTENGTSVKGAVTVFISGNRPIGAVLAESSSLVGIDGRPSDLGKGYSHFLMPIVSDNFRNYSRWDGEGEMPEADAQKIKDLAAKVHAEGRKFRLWAIPEGVNAWETLRTAGIDLINTDDLSGLREFLLTGSR